MDADELAADCRVVIERLNSEFVSIEQIKEAIEQLSFEQRAELAVWLHGSR